MKSPIKLLPGFLSSNMKYEKVMEIIDMNAFIKKYISETSSVLPICLHICEIPCKSNRCKHIFCFTCLNEWPLNKKICPMRRRAFSRIIKL